MRANIGRPLLDERLKFFLVISEKGSGRLFEAGTITGERRHDFINRIRLNHRHSLRISHLLFYKTPQRCRRTAGLLAQPLPVTRRSVTSRLSTPSFGRPGLAAAGFNLSNTSAILPLKSKSTCCPVELLKIRTFCAFASSPQESLTAARTSDSGPLRKRRSLKTRRSYQFQSYKNTPFPQRSRHHRQCQRSNQLLDQLQYKNTRYNQSILPG